jgi:hypothetical protein
MAQNLTSQIEMQSYDYYDTVIGSLMPRDGMRGLRPILQIHRRSRLAPPVLNRVEVHAPPARLRPGMTRSSLGAETAF